MTLQDKDKKRGRKKKEKEDYLGENFFFLPLIIHFEPIFNNAYLLVLEININ